MCNYFTSAINCCGCKLTQKKYNDDNDDDDGDDDNDCWNTVNLLK